MQNKETTRNKSGIGSFFYFTAIFPRLLIPANTKRGRQTGNYITRLNELCRHHFCCYILTVCFCSKFNCHVCLRSYELFTFLSQHLNTTRNMAADANASKFIRARNKQAAKERSTSWKQEDDFESTPKYCYYYYCWDVCFPVKIGWLFPQQWFLVYSFQRFDIQTKQLGYPELRHLHDFLSKKKVYRWRQGQKSLDCKL